MTIVVKSFALFGLFVAVLAAAGAIGVGHFRLYYGPDDVRCTATALDFDEAALAYMESLTQYDSKRAVKQLEADNDRNMQEVRDAQAATPMQIPKEGMDL